MVVDDFNLFCMVVRPDKTNTPLVINSNTMLPFSGACQRFKPVCRRNSKVIQIYRPVQHAQFFKSRPLNCLRQFLGIDPVKNFLRFPACKRLYHTINDTTYNVICKQKLRPEKPLFAAEAVPTGILCSSGSEPELSA